MHQIVLNEAHEFRAQSHTVKRGRVLMRMYRIVKDAHPHRFDVFRVLQRKFYTPLTLKIADMPAGGIICPPPSSGAAAPESPLAAFSRCAASAPTPHLSSRCFT